MDLTPGSRWRSAVDTTEVIVVRAPADAAELGCGGVPMVPLGTEVVGGEPHPDLAGGTLLGKRYTDDAGLELLVTKPGRGTLHLDGRPLELAEAKALPSSD